MKKKTAWNSKDQWIQIKSNTRFSITWKFNTQEEHCNVAVGGGHYLTNTVAFPSVTFPRVTLATQQVSKITEHLPWCELWWIAPEMVQSPTEILTIKGIYKDKPLRAPRDGALGQPRGTGWGTWEGGSGGGGTTSIATMWLIHTDVWQNPPQYCEVITLQLK